MTKTHKQLNKDTFCTQCGIPEYKSAKRTNDWKYVNCKTCLRFRPPFRLKDYPPKEEKDKFTEDNMDEVWDPVREAAPPVDDLDEVFDEAIKEESKNLAAAEKKTPFDKWEEWFKLCCDHPFSPQPDEVWDGAIDTVCAYLKNELCVIDDLGLSGTDEILNKAKKKFKTE